MADNTLNLGVLWNVSSLRVQESMHLGGPIPFQKSGVKLKLFFADNLRFFFFIFSSLSGGMMITNGGASSPPLILRPPSSAHTHAAFLCRLTHKQMTQIQRQNRDGDGQSAGGCCSVSLSLAASSPPLVCSHTQRESVSSTQRFTTWVCERVMHTQTHTHTCVQMVNMLKAAHNCHCMCSCVNSQR